MDQEMAVAKYDYTAAGDGELSIHKNEKLVVIDDSQPWWKVQNERSVSGYVPSNYLTRKDSNKGKKNIIDNLKNKVLKTKRTSFDPSEGNQVLDVANVKSKSGGKVLFVAFAKFKYVPQRDDEIELNQGDQVLVLEMEHDGWCRGEYKGKTGWFPFNYIQKIEQKESSTSSEYADPMDVMEKPIISKVRTLYQFKSQSKEELSFEKDVVLEIVEKPKDDPDWWQARKSTGEVGLVPRNYVEEIVSPVLTPGPAKPKLSISSVTTPVKETESPSIFSNKGWYHGTLSRSECESMLNSYAKDGEYIIRNSESKPGDFSLSMKAPNRIKHFKVLSGNNQYMIGQRSFRTIDELVAHYKSAPIYTTDGGDKMFLLTPLKKSYNRNGVR